MQHHFHYISYCSQPVPSAPADPGPGVSTLLDSPSEPAVVRPCPDTHPTKYFTKCCLFWTGLKPAHFRKLSEPVTNFSWAYDRQQMGVRDSERWSVPSYLHP